MSLTIPSNPTCDECGQPATHLAQDVQRQGFKDGYALWVHVGECRAGCNKHPVESHTYDENGNQITLKAGT